MSRSAEFERVYRQGRSKSNRYLVLYEFPRDTDSSGPPAGAGGSRDGNAGGSQADDAPAPPAVSGGPRADHVPAPSAESAGPRHGVDGPRLGLSVSRRVGGAVDRTRVKRVLREAFWAEAERLPEGSDYVVVARPDSRDLAAREGMAGVRASLAELVDGLDDGAGRHAARRRAGGEAHGPGERSGGEGDRAGDSGAAEGGASI